MVRKVATVSSSSEPVKIEPVIAPTRRARARQARDAIPFSGASGELPPLFRSTSRRCRLKVFAREKLMAVAG